MGAMKTKEQERAGFAWKKLREVTSNQTEYRNLVKSAPVLVMNNGLIQTLTFFKAKSNKTNKPTPHKILLEHIIDWLKEEGLIIVKQQKEQKDLEAIDSLLSQSSQEYQRATQETLAFLRWLRHLADARFSNAKGGQDA